MPEITIDEARALVVAAWSEDGRLQPQSIDKFDHLLTRFVRYARVFDTTRLRDVRVELVERFVRARGRDRRGQVTDAAVATMQLRRAVLRAFYRSARDLHLTWDDPARDIELPHRQSQTPRPLTPQEADVVWMHAWFGGRQTRHAATIALMLSGVHSGEVGHIVVADLDADAGVVHAHGSVKYRSRDLVVKPHHLRALVARRDLLAARHGAPLDGIVLATGAEGSDAHKQARVCTTVRELMRRAGLDDLRPASVTAVAGSEAFAATGGIQDAAEILGLSSLDAAARAIDWRWRADQRPERG